MPGLTARSLWWIGSVGVPVFVAAIGLAPFLSDRFLDPRSSPEKDVNAPVVTGDELHFGPDFSPRISALLENFATDIEAERWTDAVNYFDPDYAQEQITLLLDGPDGESYLGDAGAGQFGSAIHQFLYEALSWPGHGSIEMLKEIRFISFDSLESIAYRYWLIHFTFEYGNSKALAGSLMMEKDSHLFSGTFG